MSDEKTEHPIDLNWQQQKLLEILGLDRKGEFIASIDIAVRPMELTTVTVVRYVKDAELQRIVDQLEKMELELHLVPKPKEEENPTP